MIKKFKALKIVAYSLLGIVLMLFLSFILTYDFTKEDKYVSYATYDEASDVFDDILSDSIDQKSKINVAKIKLNSDYFNKLFVSMIRSNNDNSKYLFDNNIWKVKGLNVDFVDDEIKFSFYLMYDKTFKYNMRLTMYFGFSESESEYKLELKSLLVGSIIIPRSIIRNILSNKNKDTIGGIFNDILSVIPFGRFNSDSLSYSVKKYDLSSAVELGYIGSRTFGDNIFLMDISASYVSFLFPFDLISVDCNKGFNITLDYARAIISEKTLEQDNETRRIDYLNRVSLRNKRYLEELKYLLSDSEYKITCSDIETLYYDKLLNYEYGFNNEYVSMISSKLSIIGNEIHIVDYFRLFDMYSKIDFDYELVDNSMFVLKKIEVGRDDNENQNQYLTIKNKEETNSFLRALSSIGIYNNFLNYELDLSSVLNIDFEYESFIKNEPDEVIFTLANNDIKNEIKSAILSIEFKDLLISNEMEYQNDTIEKVIETFKNYSNNEKEKFFYLLKDFFKTETSVYNYIDNILN